MTVKQFFYVIFFPFFFFLIGSFTLAADTKFIGVVEVPPIQGFKDPNGPPGQRLSFKKKSIPVRAKPDIKSPVVKIVLKESDLSIEEYDYEVYAPSVFKIEKGWYLIKTAEGKFAWLAPSDAGPFHSYMDLAKDWSFIIQWDQKLHQTPNGPLIKIPKLAGDQQDFKVIESKEINGELWYKVVLIKPPCNEGYSEKPVTTGWIKAHEQSGTHRLRFRTRGC